MSNRRALTVIAGIVLAVGLVLAVLPLSAQRGFDEVGCGSAASTSYAAARVEDIVNRGPSWVAACEDKVSSRRLVAFPLVGVGALGLLFVWMTGQHKTRWDEPAGETSPAA